MKRWVRSGAAAILVLTLCVVPGKILMTYYQPMEDAVYDLSLGWTTVSVICGFPRWSGTGTRQCW